ncbi:MAG: glycosyltransferase family 9 protein [Bacteroidales bacterium]|nr:glycosyltransferase family 9 protein [Bacteroidales bacterium]
MKNEVRNILVIRFRRVGDSVLSMALCHSLKLTFPNANVDLVINKGIHMLYENHPDVDHVITFDNEENHSVLKYVSKVWKTMHSTHYDVIIDMRGTIKTLWFSLFSLSTPFRIGSRKGYGKGILNYQVDNHNNLMNRVQQNNMLLQPLRKIADVKESEDFRLYVTDEHKTAFRTYMQEQGVDFSRPVIIATPTARQEYKVWPKEYMKEILRRIIRDYDAQIIFNFAGDVERKCAMQYREELGNDPHIFINVEANSLPDLCALTVNCNFFFGNEGGPRHIAQAMGVPTYAIFPPGIRKGLWQPNEGKRYSGIGTEDFMPTEEQLSKKMTYEERMRLIDVESVWTGLKQSLDYNLQMSDDKD